MQFLRSSSQGQGKWALLSALALALIVAPLAVGADGDPMRVGAGNSAGVNETRIIGQDVGSYTTRQSNNKEGDGGAATYGCRSNLGNEPCLFVNALRTTRAFDFRSRGNEAGRILVFGDTSNSDNNRPFTTNATGVATGLNADEVDGMGAQQIVDAGKQRFGAVNGNGTLQNERGISSVSRTSAGNYTVNWDSDVSPCAYTATVNSINDPGTVQVERQDNDTLLVRTRGAGDSVADRPFSVVVNC